MNFTEVDDEVDTSALQQELDGGKGDGNTAAKWKWPSGAELEQMDERARKGDKALTLEVICTTALGFFLVIDHMVTCLDEDMRVRFLFDVARYRSSTLTRGERASLGISMAAQYFNLPTRHADTVNPKNRARATCATMFDKETRREAALQGLCRSIGGMNDSGGETGHSINGNTCSKDNGVAEGEGSGKDRRRESGGLSDDWRECMTDASKDTNPLGLGRNILSVPSQRKTRLPLEEEKYEDGDGESEKKGIREEEEEDEEWPLHVFDRADMIIWSFLKDIHGLADVHTLSFWPTFAQFRAISQRAPEPADFTLFRVLGKGGFGLVSGCKHKASGRLYAMKAMDRKRVKLRHSWELCLNERHALQRVLSPFVVQLHYAFSSATDLVLVMDLMQGGDLDYHLKQQQSKVGSDLGGGVGGCREGFSLDAVRYFVARTILGLEHLHDEGFVYRDLKPENVLLDDIGRSKLSDLGLVGHCQRRDAPGYQPLSVVCGTPGYKAPEMISRQGYGFEADWFSLGCMMYELLCGECPFHSETARTWTVLDEHGQAGRNVPKCIDQATLDMEVDLAASTFMNRAENEIEKGNDETQAAISLCHGMLEKNPRKRLGRHGASELKSHNFFADFDWAALAADELPPPYKPSKGVNAANQSSIGEFVDVAGITLTAEDDGALAASNWEYTNLVTFDCDALHVMEQLANGVPGAGKAGDVGCGGCIIL